MHEVPNRPLKILDLIPHPRQVGDVSFVIAPGASSEDVIATLIYINPDNESVKRQIMRLFDHIVESGNLSNLTIDINDPEGQVNSQTTLTRRLTFSENPTIDDVIQAFEAAYGEENAFEGIRLLFDVFVNRGVLNGIKVIASQRNEIITASTEEINFEMQELTDQYYRENGLS